MIPTFSTEFHGPALIHEGDGVWTVFCPGCSSTWQDIVYVCDDLKTQWPAQRLVSIERLAAVNKVDDNVVRLSKHATDTQRTAASRALPKSGTRRREILYLIDSKQGLTDDELEEITGWSHQATSASRNSLMRDGFITDSGERRVNRHGNPAIVWRVVK